MGSRFGDIPTGFPRIAIPEFRADLILPLLPSAITVALLAAIESLLSAVVGDSMTGDRHDSSVELVARGVANVVVPLFGGIPATGAIARTATNIRSGARRPIAGMIQALTLLVIVLVAAPLARFVPLATLTAVLLVVAYNMGEWRQIRPILRLSGPDQVPDYVSILRIHGPFLFGTTEKLSEATADLTPFAPIVVLRLRNMTALDATGLHAIESLADRLHESGRTLLICGARDQPANLIERSTLYEHVGTDGSLPHIEAALARARELMAQRENTPTLPA